MSVNLIVDSTCDYSPAEAAQLGLGRAPLTVHWDGQEYRDGLDMTPPEFFERLGKSSSLPTTSQVAVPVFEDLFRQATAQGGQAVVLLISQNLSGTYQSATIARESFGGKSSDIHLVDTGSGSLGSMLIVQEAIKLRDAGMPAAQIAETLNNLRQRLVILACVETLKFLHKGGRLSTGAAVVGTLLSVKPVLRIVDGKIEVAGKVRGNAAAYQWVGDALAKEGFDPDYPVIIGSTQCPELTKQFTQTVTAKAGISVSRYCDIGTVIGTHVGTGTVGIAYIKK